MAETYVSGPAGAGSVRPLRNMFGPLRWAVIAYAIGEAGLIVANSGELFYLGQGIDIYAPEETQGLMFAIASGIFGIVQLISLIVSVVFMSRWTFRAMKNLHTVRDPGVTMSPGWAVGWYFIPFANLWKPLSGMMQIWRGSMAQAGESERVRPVVGWWWATWLASNFLANIGVRLGGWTGDGQAYYESLWVNCAGSAVSIICSILMLKVTRRVTDAQTRMEQSGVSSVFA